MIFYLKLYLASLAVFFALDMAWLGWLARPFYHRQLGFLLAPATNWYAAVLFYLLFVLGILYFVVVPSLAGGALAPLLLRAALYGLITYATYDLTNLATLKNWPVLLTAVDMLWGVMLSTLVSLAAFYIARALR